MKKTILSESEDVGNAEIENMLKGMDIGLIGIQLSGISG